MSFNLLNDAAGARMALVHIDDEPRDKPAQIEAAVEAVGEGAEVQVGVLAVLVCLVGARQRGFIEAALTNLKLLALGDARLPRTDGLEGFKFIDAGSITLPRKVLTSLKLGSPRGLCWPTTKGTWLQPASITTAKVRRFVTGDAAAGLEVALAHCLTA